MHRWPRNVLLLLLAVGLAIGLAIWVKADSGTKGVDLGAGLVATGGFGGILVFLERELSQRIERAKVEIQATAPVGPPIPDTGTDLPSAETPADYARLFTAQFTG